MFSYFAMIFFYLLNLLQNSWQNKISILYEYIAHNNRKLNCLSIAVMTLYSSLVFIMAKFLLNIHKGRSSQQWRTWAKVEDYFLTSREAACVTVQMLHCTKNDFQGSHPQIRCWFTQFMNGINRDRNDWERCFTFAETRVYKNNHKIQKISIKIEDSLIVGTDWGTAWN